MKIIELFASDAPGPVISGILVTLLLTHVFSWSGSKCSTRLLSSHLFSAQFRLGLIPVRSRYRSKPPGFYNIFFFKISLDFESLYKYLSGTLRQPLKNTKSYSNIF